MNAKTDIGRDQATLEVGYLTTDLSAISTTLTNESKKERKGRLKRHNENRRSF
jgi:hypothetical protein